MVYAYTGGNGSAHAIGGLVFDRRGNLYGTTAWGGQDAPGTVYELERSGSGFVYNELYDSGRVQRGLPLGRSYFRSQRQPLCHDER